MELIEALKAHEESGTSRSEEAKALDIELQVCQEKQTSLTYKPWEIVFVSSDNSPEEFREYFSSMPWLAVDYDRDSERKLSKYKCLMYIMTSED